MEKVDTRQVNRESLLLLANLRVDGQEPTYRVRVRNLSAGGMMAESNAMVTRGARVSVELRNIGWVEGTVAWKQDNRFGIAFIDNVEPTLAREPIVVAVERREETRRFSPIRPPVPDPDKLRKI